MHTFNYLYQHIGDNIQIHTNGCDICVYDARKFANTLPKDEKAIVYNTCSVFGIRELENHLIIELLQKSFPDHKLYILGCDINNNPKNYQKYDNTYCNEKVQKIIESNITNDSVKTNEPLIYIKIQDGCPHKCSFCIINKLRSTPYSVPYSVILETVKQQVKDNSRVEIAGTELTCYYDSETGYNLVDVLRNLIKDVPNIGRITLTSIDPQPSMTDDLIKLIGNNPNKFVPHIILAVQSGSDRILKLMNRRHNVSRVKDLHSLANLYNISLGWDIIVCFPGETEEDYLDTYYLMQELKPLTQTIFEYSPREGTSAFTMDNQVPDNIKHLRCTQLKEMMKGYAKQGLAGFDSYAEYTEELTKYEQVQYIKNKIKELIINNEADIRTIDLDNVDDIVQLIKSHKSTDIINVIFKPENAEKHEIYINFFKEFLPDIPVIVNMPKNYDESTEEFENTYHCKVRRF